MAPSPRSSESATQRRRKLVEKKMSDLTAALAAPSERSPSRDADFLSSDTLAKSLFGPAPAEFLETKTIAELVNIVHFCAAALDAVAQTRTTVDVRSHAGNGYVSFAVALSDRPFVVNTIIEVFRHAGVSVLTNLYPVITHDQGRISLNYIETEAIDDERCAALARRLQSSLKDLILVTDDFPEMETHTKRLASHIKNASYAAPYERFDQSECAALLEWIADGNFVFLGHAEWKLDRNGQPISTPTVLQGMFRSAEPYLSELIAESKEQAELLLDQKSALNISKLKTESPVHRLRHMTHFALVELGSNSRPQAVHSLVGLLTSKALSQEGSLIPLVRRRAQALLESEGAVENSHDFKNIIDIIDRMPKEEVLRLEVEELRELVHTVREVQSFSDVRVHVRFDVDHRGEQRGLSVVVLLPRERFNAQTRYTIQDTLEASIGAERGSAQFHLDMSNKPHARLYFYLPISATRRTAGLIDAVHIKHDVLSACRTWRENLESLIAQSSLLSPSTRIRDRYGDAFPADYQALFPVEDCEFDIRAMDQLSETSRVRVGISCHSVAGASSDSSEAHHSMIVPIEFTLIVYSYGTEITISKAVPLLENAGLDVIAEQSSVVTPRDSQPIFLHRFRVRSTGSSRVTIGGFDQVLGPGLAEIFAESLEGVPAGNDPLNSLMLSADLSRDSIAVLRAYCYLLWQVNKAATRRTIILTLAGAPQCARHLWHLFRVLFDPDYRPELSHEQRREEFRAGMEQFRDLLRSVNDLTKDRILRQLAELLEHTVRTNYFIERSGGQKNLIAFKLASEMLQFIPQPRPKYEIFIYSPTVEGVHLRSGMVARGGIRWSDRYEDYRSEVLGLMKTQKIKNVVIVPTGAKGGFVVKNLPTESAAIPAAVKAAYREFVRALLSITDNRIDGAIVTPPRVIRHDGDDPYLVVAADKGTATFSDTANTLATEEYRFWLGDAFASGGSNGYDHKIYAITAKGAWECSKRLLQLAGIDYERQPFTVVGIGDMSGDVFGNGLLLSRSMKLIGAFNHKHIFIDPNPDPERSWQERERLFRTPGSQWSDYNTGLLSTGGGIFGRFDKEITLSSQAREALGVNPDAPRSFTGEQVINLILKAPADLLWNGGIGTYVKSSSESNAEVLDSSNDAVRVNADELRSRVIAEGGNLGFTQRARIEFALRGGLLNTDAIDNSGGVDLSDHEVNLKILFSSLVRRGALTIEARNVLLKEVAPHVVDSVLDHNRGHVLLLTLEKERSREKLEQFQSLIRYLARAGFVSRELESLPDDEEMSERSEKGLGLTRPELAVCTAATKMWLKAELLESALPQDSRLDGIALNYFPAAIQTRYPREIVQHPLRTNIVATELTNSVVEGLGITYVHGVVQQHGVTPRHVLTCAVAAYLLTDAECHRRELAILDRPETGEHFLRARARLSTLLREVTTWLIRHYPAGTSLDVLLTSHDGLRNEMREAFAAGPGHETKVNEDRDLDSLKEAGISESCVQVLAAVPHVRSILDVVWVSHRHALPFRDVARTYRQIADMLGIAEVLGLVANAPAHSKWERSLALALTDEIHDALGRLVPVAMRSSNSSSADEMKQLAGFDEIRSVATEIAQSMPPELSALAVLSKKLAGLASVAEESYARSAHEASS